MAFLKGISIIFLGIGVLFTSVENLTAGDVPDAEEIGKEIANNVSEEFVICAAFYSICTEAVSRSGDPQTVPRYEEAFDAALYYALTAAKKGRTQEMAEKVTLARLELYMKSMTGEIDNDMGNISILLNKYLYRCILVMENPAKVFDDWSEKIFRKYGLQE